MTILSSDYPRIILGMSSNRLSIGGSNSESVQCNLELKDFVAGAVFGEVRGWHCLLRALEMTFHMWRGSNMRCNLRGRCSIWWGSRLTLLAPRILNDVSYVTRINHEIQFAWQAQYLVRFEVDFACSAHSKWRFICDADQSWDSFCVAGAVFGEGGGWLLLLRITSIASNSIAWLYRSHDSIWVHIASHHIVWHDRTLQNIRSHDVTWSWQDTKNHITSTWRHYITVITWRNSSHITLPHVASGSSTLLHLTPQPTSWHHITSHHSTWHQHRGTAESWLTQKTWLMASRTATSRTSHPTPLQPIKFHDSALRHITTWQHLTSRRMT